MLLMFEAVLRRLQPFAQEFTKIGKNVYLVGGAVRNLLLERPVEDYDFTTDALPEEVQGHFKRVIATGLRHGTVTVLFQGDSYEVTTFRIDGDYTDGRRPDSVEFTPSLEEDLKRRDFTINALALDLVSGELIDHHGGKADLKDGVLRAIGVPGQRFDEDALRLLRLFRFASQLGFRIDASTLAAVPSRRSKLASVSRERVREELAKSVAGLYPGLALAPLFEMGFLADVFAPMTLKGLSSSTFKRLEGLAPDLRWSVWLTLSCPKDRSQWDQALRRLTFSNADIAAFLGPAKALDLLTSSGQTLELAKPLVSVWGSRDRVATGLAYLEALESEGFWIDTSGLKKELARVASSSDPIFLSELAVDGKDLLAAGIPTGPLVGQILRELQKVVWNNPSLNSAETLRKLAPTLR